MELSGLVSLAPVGVSWSSGFTLDMVQVTSAAGMSRKLNVVRVCLLLTPTELSQLDQGIEDCGVPVPRGFILFEATQTGLMNSTIPQHEPNRLRIYFRVPREMKERVRALANQTGQSQQHILRQFLHEYLNNPPWKPANTKP
jgi:hypothetical protein